VRLQNSDISKGKSGGYRLIYYIKTADFVILITIYTKSEVSDIPADEIRRLIDEYDKNQQL
jgi:mRNA-degrading endonuclease RelE of RelBE toxin-antitoxin system